MSTPSESILILSSNTGGGHQSAARALQESFLRLSPGQVLVNIAHVLEEAHYLTHRLADIYNYLLRYHQHYMRYYYWAIQKLRPYESHALFQLSLKYGMQILERLAPTALVSVHPMTQHFFAYMLKKLRLSDKIPLITVVTDPCSGFWKGWACPEVAQYFVASEGAREQLVEYGVEEARIQITGMPVHSKFKPVTDAEKRRLKESFHLDPNRFTVLVNAGWIGGGNVPLLYQALMKAPQENLQLVFLSGKNSSLHDQAEQLSQDARCSVTILGFTNEMEKLMNASDLMISKLGGLTTFEAMACQLPILADCLTPPMPQEAGTARFIETQGAGVLITRPEQVLLELEKLNGSSERYMQMKSAAAAIGRPGAVDTIAQSILSRIS